LFAQVWLVVNNPTNFWPTAPEKLRRIQQGGFNERKHFFFYLTISKRRKI